MKKLTAIIAAVILAFVIALGDQIIKLNAFDSIRSFATRVGGQCQLWVVPGARHGEAIGVDTASYHRRTSRFLNQAMQARPAGQRQKPSEPSHSVVSHGQISSMPAH